MPSAWVPLQGTLLAPFKKSVGSLRGKGREEGPGPVSPGAAPSSRAAGLEGSDPHPPSEVPLDLAVCSAAIWGPRGEAGCSETRDMWKLPQGGSTELLESLSTFSKVKGDPSLPYVR